MKGSCNAKDVVGGKIKPSDIEVKYFIIYDTGKLDNLGIAVNMMAEEGWVVRASGGVSNGGFLLLEKT